MTGWQSADGHDSLMCQQNNEIVELSRIISQLAMANHQLASAHGATLARMETLYSELSKDREDRKRKMSTEGLEMCEDVSRRRLQDEEVAKEEMQRLEQRVVRLEQLLAARSFGQCKPNLQEDGKVCSRTETSETSPRTRDTKNENSCLRSAESRCESTEQRTSHVVIDPISEVPDDCGARETDNQICCSAHSNDSETNIPKLDEDSCSMNVDLDKVRRRRARLRDNEQDPVGNPASGEIFKLSEEVERLKADRLEFQSTNERLLRSLTENLDQKNLAEKLGVDYEV